MGQWTTAPCGGITGKGELIHVDMRCGKRRTNPAVQVMGKTTSGNLVTNDEGKTLIPEKNIRSQELFKLGYHATGFQKLLTNKVDPVV